MAEVFKPIGPTNFQFRTDGEVLKLLEINPRISSATSIRASLGYNESVMSINYFLNNQIPTKMDKSKIINKRAIRYLEDYIF
jgi:carbamoyl-phosphate synthase large subunit